MSTPFRVGVAKVDITPSPAMINWVNGEPYDGILDPIYARALLIDDGRERVAIVVLDIATISSALAASIRSAVEAAHGIPPRNVLVQPTQPLSRRPRIRHPTRIFRRASPP